ncbi:MAG: pyruvate kinase, partial [Anaerovoracaceae bacterium]
MKKTKIVCTLGPATDDLKLLREMMQSGMDVARFNFSHGTYEEHKKRIDEFDKIRNELDLHTARLLDTKGPEVRLKNFKADTEKLLKGDFFSLITEDCLGDKNKCSITYAKLAEDVEIGTKILLDDGLIELEVVEVSKREIKCKILNEGIIKSNKGVNIPKVKLKMPYISEKDREDIAFGIENKFNFIAASFVSSAEDILEIRQILAQHNCDTIRIIAKIENSEGVENIKEILSVSDGIMIARGDMGVEIPIEEIPRIQKEIIKESVKRGKPVITATQMLESMIASPRPTRAEITDVANAIYDGTSAIMLSGETAIGKYPLEALKTMATIAKKTEEDNYHSFKVKEDSIDEQLGIADAMAHAACVNAKDIQAKALIVASKSGNACRLLSRYRPKEPIIACVLNEHTAKHLMLTWGAFPIIMPKVNSSDELLDISVSKAQEAGFIKSGDAVVIMAGMPVGISGTTNIIKAHLVGDRLLTGVGIGKKPASGKVCKC